MLGFDSLNPFVFLGRQTWPCFTAVEEDGGDWDLYRLNLLAKLMVLHCHILFSLAIVATADEILMRTSAEQVPSLHKNAPRYLKLVTFSNF